MFRIDLPQRLSLSDPPRNFTRQLGRHAALLHWWTLQHDALHTNPEGGQLGYLPRKGGVTAWLWRDEAPLTDRAMLDTEEIGDRLWPANPKQHPGGCWAEAEIPLEKTGLWSIVSITRTGSAGSDPWGLSLDPQNPALMQLVNATTSGEMSIRAFDPAPERREDVNIGRAVELGRVSVTAAALDLDSGAFRIANRLDGGFEEGHCARMVEQAEAARHAGHARLAIGRAWREQPIGGAFLECLVIRGDLFALPELRADLADYFTTQWEGPGTS